MVCFSVRFKSVVLAGMMVASSSSVMMLQADAPAEAIPFVFTKGKIAAAVTFFTLWAIWDRLITKGSKWDYTTANWREDFEALLNSYNIFDAESRATLMRLFDKWIVGRQLSIIDVTYREKDEDGMVITRKDKQIKARPFGAMGLFDAYILGQLKKTQEVMVPAAFMFLVFRDPISHFLK